MKTSGLPLLESLRQKQLELERQADETNQERRRVFKSWFTRNLWMRYARHTKGMNPQPSIVDWLQTKQLDDTYRGSDKDTNTSTKGDHGYQFTTRLKWSAQVFRTALAIVIESLWYIGKLILGGRPVTAHQVSDVVRGLIDEALEELIALHEPDSTYGLVVTIKFPEGLLFTASMEQLQEADVTIIFVRVNRTL